MKFLGTTCCAVALMVSGTLQPGNAQLTGSRIPYANRNIFVSGINIAWVNFAGDLGPGAPNLSQFQTEFQMVHNNGGNALRLWLHTNGTNTPTFNGQGYVTGPGPVALQNLSQILDLAMENNVGLILCLWSHDMLNQSEMDTAKLHRNARLLTDTAYTNAYIRNALIPMVEEVAGHPAIVAWEIFNEPEGITDEFGWSGRDHVPMASIQRCVNLMAGAIHTADPYALVTNGANSFQTLTDVNPSAKIETPSLKKQNAEQQTKIVNEFNARHRLNLSVEQYLDYLDRVGALANTNYYRDDRLIAAGGDPLGTLDFYCVHYYTGSSGYSPFTHPFSYWGLNKPTVLGEFFMQATDGVASLSLIPALYQTGYAGALVWSWTDFSATNSAADTWTSLNYMFSNHKKDVIINPVTGTIYSFEANPSTIEKTDSTQIIWDVEPGSAVSLNGNTVSVHDSIKIAPLTGVSYTLVATGEVTETDTATVTVLPSGRILSFSVNPVHIGLGEPATLIWHVVKGSTVTLNTNPVPVVDTVTIYPTEPVNTYTLSAAGDENTSATVTVKAYPPDQVNRAFGAGVTASSNDSVAYSSSKVQNMVDEDENSRWQSIVTAGSQWVRFDLGMVDSINKVVIHWGDHAYAKQYFVSVSSDLVHWPTLKSVTNGTGGTDYVETLDNLKGLGRYVKITLSVRGSERTYYSISEVYVYGFPVATGIEVPGEGLPAEYSLSQNYPNPFNPTTSINFSVVKASTVRLTVFDILGQKVAVLVDGQMNAGTYTVTFDASRLATGIYFYRLEAGNFMSNKKMVLLK